MSLKDQGHRFCLSPDWQRARWLSPTIRSAIYPDWLDVTDMDSDELAEQPHPVNRSVIRDVFLRNGFTIKEGHADLKPYVYAAAEELLALDGKAVAVEQDAVAVPAGITIDRDLMGTMHIKCGDFDFIQIQYQYPYTDNASTRRLAEQIAALLGGDA